MSDEDTKQLFGKVLGEIYRLHYLHGRTETDLDKSRIFGLINGFEKSIDEEMSIIGWTSESTQTKIEWFLDELTGDEELLDKMKGFDDVLECLKKRDKVRINDWRFRLLLQLLYSEGKFQPTIENLFKKQYPQKPFSYKLSSISDWPI